MPNGIVHCTFAKKYALDVSPKMQKVVYLGAMGPDPFFFYGMLSKRNRPYIHEVRSLGGVTQHQELTPNYVAMIEYAKKSPDKDLLLAYIDGLFMHYAVDRAVHPFVFWNTGFTDRPQDGKKIQDYYNFGHLNFEVFLDLIIGKREGTFTNLTHYVGLPKKQLLAISKMWYEVNKNNQKVPHIEIDSFAKCIQDARMCFRLTYSPLGIKKAFIGRLMGKQSFAYGFSCPRNLKKFEGIDFLNEAYKAWYMPDNSGPRYDSFFELYDVEAKAIYESCHACLEKAKAGLPYEQELEAAGKHLNHEGIIPNSPKLTWKLIWPAWFQVDIIQPEISHD